MEVNEQKAPQVNEEKLHEFLVKMVTEMGAAAVGLALGAQAREKRLRDVAIQGGFKRFRRATETPFNLILEARP